MVLLKFMHVPLAFIIGIITISATRSSNVTPLTIVSGNTITGMLIPDSIKE